MAYSGAFTGTSWLYSGYVLHLTHRSQLSLTGCLTVSLTVSLTVRPSHSLSHSHSRSLPHDIRFCSGKVTQIVSEWGEIFVLTADRKMQQLTEKDVQTKLEMLYKKVLAGTSTWLADVICFCIVAGFLHSGPQISRRFKAV